jgi:methylenetetrahydrofolate reductase (NADPH)
VRRSGTEAGGTAPVSDPTGPHKAFSFEFFPPRTPEGQEKLRQARALLARVDPLFVSVTYGAGGSTRDRTFHTVAECLAEGLDTAPHLSCIGLHRDEILQLLEDYRGQGVRRIVALRGDMPSGMGEAGDFRHADELVRFIRAETGDHFLLEVAAYPEFHPQAPDALTDLRNFKRKVEAGANSAITQYFFNADAYFSFVDSVQDMGVEIPIVPGIMPITNYAPLARFSDACGAEIPRWIRKRLQAYEEDAQSLRRFGEEVVTDLCRRLLEGGAPGLHFYTMNRAQPTLAIWKHLGLPGAERLQEDP